MNEIRTLHLLYEAIEKEWAWRIIELSNYRSNILSQRNNIRTQNALIRAGIALLYAHWEGFIKKSADLYYEFVSFQNCTLNELNDCFISIVLRSEIDQLQNSKKLTLHNEVVKSFIDRQHKKAFFSSTSPIRTSNLKYPIFEDVCLMLGIDINNFHNRYILRNFDRNIEKTINDLVEKRNYVAHGDYLPIQEKEYMTLYDVIINGLLLNFKEMIMDSAQNNQFKRQ